jgi:DNA-binding NtrC family response regulator
MAEDASSRGRLEPGRVGRVAADNVASLNLRLPPTGDRARRAGAPGDLEALRISNWVQKDAAKFLGISSRVMNYKVAKYEIKNTRWSKNKLVG